MKTSRRGGALVAILAAFGAVVLILLVTGLFFGWVGWSDDSQRTILEIDKVELQRDTNEAVDTTQEALHGVAETIEGAARDLQTEDEVPVTPVPEPDETLDDEV